MPTSEQAFGTTPRKRRLAITSARRSGASGANVISALTGSRFAQTRKSASLPCFFPTRRPWLIPVTNILSRTPPTSCTRALGESTRSGTRSRTGATPCKVRLQQTRTASSCAQAMLTLSDPRRYRKAVDRRPGRLLSAREDDDSDLHRSDPGRAPLGPVRPLRRTHRRPIHAFLSAAGVVPRREEGTGRA